MPQHCCPLRHSWRLMLFSFQNPFLCLIVFSAVRKSNAFYFTIPFCGDIVNRLEVSACISTSLRFLSLQVRSQIIWFYLSDAVSTWRVIIKLDNLSRLNDTFIRSNFPVGNKENGAVTYSPSNYKIFHGKQFIVKSACFLVFA